MKRQNPLKERFLTSLPLTLIENVADKFRNNLSFNFQFFDNAQPAGQDFRDWNHEQLHKLLDKVKEYCKNPSTYWLKLPVGGGKNHILEIYGKFPVRSEFLHPKFVPLDVDWARFRLEGDMRLIGFFVNKEICTRLIASPNIFYVVFLDREHKFYKQS